MTHKTPLSDDNISKIFSDATHLTQTLQSGIHSALLKHKQAGNAVCEWRNSTVVWVSPENILKKSKNE